MADDQPRAHLDITRWVEGLTEDLSRADELYRASGDDIRRHQECSAMLIASLFSRISELPGPASHTLTLGNLLTAFDDLTNDKSHPLLQKLVKKGGAQSLTWTELATQAQAVAGIEMLTASGMREKDAVEFVTARADEAGIKGFRQRKKLTPSAVRTWRTNANSGSHDALRKMAHESLELARLRFAEQGISWPPRQVEAQADVRRLFENELIRSWAVYSNSGQGVE